MPGFRWWHRAAGRREGRLREKPHEGAAQRLGRVAMAALVPLVGVLAQSSPPAPRPAVMAPLSGANSFTESQARRRPVAAGYVQVTVWRKDEHDTWRHSPTPGGKPANAGLDFQGRVVPSPASPHTGNQKAAQT